MKLKINVNPKEPKLLFHVLAINNSVLNNERIALGVSLGGIFPYITSVDTKLRNFISPSSRT